jgi:hypothetical protein
MRVSGIALYRIPCRASGVNKSFDQTTPPSAGLLPCRRYAVAAQFRHYPNILYQNDFPILSPSVFTTTINASVEKRNIKRYESQ